MFVALFAWTLAFVGMVLRMAGTMRTRMKVSRHSSRGRSRASGAWPDAEARGVTQKLRAARRSQQRARVGSSHFGRFERFLPGARGLQRGSHVGVPLTARVLAKSPIQSSLPRWLPSEHGFWVMLGAALASAIVRAHGHRLGLIVAIFVAAAAIFGGGLSHRRIRKSHVGQLSAAGLLALTSVPVEFVAGLPLPSIASATLSRAVVFVASALVVRAAFARSARNGGRRSLRLSGASLVIPALAATLLFALGWSVEAGTCVIAGATCAVFAWSRPSVKQLKPLGLALGCLSLVTAITLAL